MKNLWALTFVAVIFAGCSSTSVRQPVTVRSSSEPARYASDDEQRRLHDQARANFARLKDEMSGPNRSPRIARADNLPSVEEAPQRLHYVSEVAWQAPISRSAADEDAAERTREADDRRWEVQQRMNNFRAFEAGYARQLGKKPSQLTREELEWVRNNFE